MEESRLRQQIRFIEEIDKLKQIYRQNVVIGTARQENDAEHSWHLAAMSILLTEHAAKQEMDTLRMVRMLLVHDLVEIYAGDTYCYDEQGYADKDAREQAAARQLFSLLPPDQAGELWELWREFEELQTPEARFAACMDRLQPLILNHATQGHTWRRPGITSEMVLKRNELLRENAPALWEYAKEVIEDCVEKGYLRR